MSTKMLCIYVIIKALILYKTNSVWGRFISKYVLYIAAKTQQKSVELRKYCEQRIRYVSFQADF